MCWGCCSAAHFVRWAVLRIEPADLSVIQNNSHQHAGAVVDGMQDEDVSVSLFLQMPRLSPLSAATACRPHRGKISQIAAQSVNFQVAGGLGPGRSYARTGLRGLRRVIVHLLFDGPKPTRSGRCLTLTDDGFPTVSPGVSVVTTGAGRTAFRARCRLGGNPPSCPGQRRARSRAGRCRRRQAAASAAILSNSRAAWPRFRPGGSCRPSGSSPSAPPPGCRRGSR